MGILETISAVALGFGAYLGLRSLFQPHWAARIVRLEAETDPARPGGFAEFRATYGGLLLMTHATALAAILTLPPTLGLMAALPLALGWLGAALGRTLSLLLDRAELREAALNPIWIGTELALALAIACPLLQFV